MGELLEDMTYEELKEYNKKEISSRLNELEVPHDLNWSKDELIDLLRAEGGQFDHKEVQEIEAEKYAVVNSFKDLEDGGYVYIAGDKYPRKANKNVTTARVNELLGKNNKLKKQLIKE